MKQNQQNAPRDLREEDRIVLGVASIETKGLGGFVETNGIGAAPVISEE